MLLFSEKTLARLTKKKKRYYKWYLRNTRYVREYYEQLHANKLDDLEEIVNFYNHVWNMKKRENLNLQISSKEIESVIKNLQ